MTAFWLGMLFQMCKCKSIPKKNPVNEKVKDRNLGNILLYERIIKTNLPSSKIYSFKLESFTLHSNESRIKQAEVFFKTLCKKMLLVIYTENTLSQY